MLQAATLATTSSFVHSSSTSRLQRIDKVFVFQIGKIRKRILVVRLLAPCSCAVCRLLGAHIRPLATRDQRVIDVWSGFTHRQPRLIVLAVENLQPKHLENDSSDEHAQDGEIACKTGLVVWRLFLLVQLRTDDVPDRESDVEAARGNGLLGVTGGIGETGLTPRTEQDGCDWTHHQEKMTGVMD